VSDADDTLLGLFPLGIVLLPGEVVPLHIFEERYKKLIGERLDEGEFGVVLVEDDTVRQCGTAARVTQLIEEMDDGRMNVVVEGGRRFRIIEVREPADPETDYLSAEVEFYRDAEPEGSPALRAAVLEVFGGCWRSWMWRSRMSPPARVRSRSASPPPWTSAPRSSRSCSSPSARSSAWRRCSR
jgi:Lon protease-like protein